MVPYWATWPFETRCSGRHLGVSEADGGERTGLAAILKSVTTRYDNLFGVSFPDTMGFISGQRMGRRMMRCTSTRTSSAAAALGGGAEVYGWFRDAGDAAAGPDAGEQRRSGCALPERHYAE